MKKIVFCFLFFLFLSSTLFAINENTYVQFAADSIIIAHGLEGNPRAAELWMNEMRKKYPGFMGKDLQLFEAKIMKDSTLKSRIYSRILENIRSKGYNARIVDLGGGVTTIKIGE